MENDEEILRKSGEIRSYMKYWEISLEISDKKLFFYHS